MVMMWYGMVWCGEVMYDVVCYNSDVVWYGVVQGVVRGPLDLILIGIKIGIWANLRLE